MISTAATSAPADAAATVIRQSIPPSALMRYGDADPSVSAPTRMPTIRPMSPLAQVDASFIPTGYTPAMHTPVTKRSSGAGHVVGSTTSSSALASAPTSAESANSRRGSARSASPSDALARQPATKPACTLLVSAACMKLDRRNSATSAGITADAENQSAIAATWHSAISATAARFDAKTPVATGSLMPSRRTSCAPFPAAPDGVRGCVSCRRRRAEATGTDAGAPPPASRNANGRRACRRPSGRCCGGG